MHRLIRSRDYLQGRWPNGLGVSWEIAREENWRLAIARIDSDVPFSQYPGIDRLFTLIEGQGLDLDVAGLGRLTGRPFEPIRFPGDRATTCQLRGGPCRALNLFLKRGLVTAEVEVVQANAAVKIDHPQTTLIFTAGGKAEARGFALEAEDTLIAEGPFSLTPNGPCRVYVARLEPGGSK